DFMPVFKLHAEHRIGEQFLHPAAHLKYFFLRHRRSERLTKPTENMHNYSKSKIFKNGSLVLWSAGPSCDTPRLLGRVSKREQAWMPYAACAAAFTASELK